MRLATSLLALPILLLAAGPVGAQQGQATIRSERPRELSLGVTALLEVSGDDVLPMPIVEAVWNLLPRAAVLADLSYMDYRDRVFGPRVLAAVGGRGYLLPGPVSPYATVRFGLYHEFDVDYPYSDASQDEGDWLLSDLVVGNEIATRGGFTWTIEVGLTHLGRLRRLERDRPSYHAQTMFGYRF
jgi:hypothetical protein